MYFSVEEVARLLNLNEETIRRQIRSHQIEAEKVGRSWRISEAQNKRLFEQVRKAAEEGQRLLDAAAKKMMEENQKLSMVSHEQAARKAAEEGKRLLDAAAKKMMEENQKLNSVLREQALNAGESSQKFLREQGRKYATCEKVGNLPSPFFLLRPSHFQIKKVI